MAGPDSDVFSDPEIDDYFLELDDAELATNSRYTAAVADDDANTCIDTPEASDDVFPSSKAYPGCSGDSAVVKYPFNDGVGTVGGDWLPARSGEGEDSSATNPMTNRGEETIQPTAGNTQKEGKAAQNTEDILVDGAGLQSSRALADDSSPPTTQKPSPDDSQPAAASLARLSGMKPFVRGPIPKAVQPRSIIVGLDTRTLVRTCFRLGEAIRFGSARQGMPDNSERGDILVELYGWLRIPLALRRCRWLISPKSARLVFGEGGQPPDLSIPRPLP